jgi:hypothetical protein
MPNTGFTDTGRDFLTPLEPLPTIRPSQVYVNSLNGNNAGAAATAAAAAINPIGTALGGISDFLKVGEVKNSTNIQLPTDATKSDNSALYYIGAAVLILVVVIFFIIRKK